MAKQNSIYFAVSQTYFIWLQKVMSTLMVKLLDSFRVIKSFYTLYNSLRGLEAKKESYDRDVIS